MNKENSGKLFVDLVDYRNRKNLDKAIGQIDDAHNSGADVWIDFALLMENDPIEAVNKISSFIDKTRDYRAEAYAGGPDYHKIIPIINVLGGVYPFLERDVRKKGLKQVLSFFDGLNTIQSQNYIEYIHDPWLASDVLINRTEYRCVNKEYVELLERKGNRGDFFKNLDKTRSKFFLCLVVIQPKFSSLEMRRDFYKQFPKLVDKTLDGVAALSYNHALYVQERKGMLVEEYLRKSLSKYDPLLHNRIWQKIGEEKWIKLEA